MAKNTGKNIYNGGKFLQYLNLKEQNWLQSEKLFRYFSGHTPVVYFIIDTKGRFLLSEGKGLAKLGLKPGQVVGKSVFDIYANYPEIINAVNAALNGKPADVLIEFEGIYFDTSFTPIVENNIIVGIAGIANDVTEQETTRKTLIQNQERTRTILQHLSDIIWIVNENLEIVYESPSVAHLLGFEPDFFIGKYGLDYVHPDDRTNAFTEFEKVIKSNNEHTPTEIRLLHKNGHCIPVSIFGQNLINHNAIKGILLFGRDLSERKAHEKILIDYQTHLEHVVQERTEQIFQMNVELTQVNAGITTTNNELQELNSKLTSEIIARKKAQNELEIQKQQLETTLNDLKKTQSFLVESEKMASLGVLTAGIAHEINNPVNYIGASIEGLSVSLNDIKTIVSEINNIDPLNYQNSIANIEALKKRLEYNELLHSIDVLISNIRKGSNRITEIVRSLSNFARVSDNEPKLSDIHELIESTLIILHNQLRGKIHIIKQYGVIPEVTCFAGKISQVLMNLLSNAIQAIDDCGSITITTHNLPDDRLISISIKDTGCGIEEEIIEKIFEPFFTTKETGKGTGLGLSITYNIIQKHKGRIIVNSTLGIGSEFIIYLPVNPNLVSL